MISPRAFSCVVAGMLCATGAYDLIRAAVDDVRPRPIALPAIPATLDVPDVNSVSESDLAAAIDANPFHLTRGAVIADAAAELPAAVTPEDVDGTLPTLLGTTVGPDGEKALIAWIGDSTHVVEPGWTHRNLRILSITRGTLTLSRADSIISLRLPGHENQ
jgi:hypothetical protein